MVHKRRPLRHAAEVRIIGRARRCIAIRDVDRIPEHRNLRPGGRVHEASDPKVKRCLIRVVCRKADISILCTAHARIEPNRDRVRRPHAEARDQPVRHREPGRHRKPAQCQHTRTVIANRKRVANTRSTDDHRAVVRPIRSRRR